MGSGPEVLAVVISEPWRPSLYHRVKRCAWGGWGEGGFRIGDLGGDTDGTDRHTLIFV